jgi:hypothetical protein
MHQLEALIVGSILTTEFECNPLDPIADKFKTVTHIMSKEVATRLLEHTPYDHRRELKTGETSQWGPCYALSKTEFEDLREGLKDMLETAKFDGQNPLPPHQYYSFQQYIAEVYDCVMTMARLTKFRLRTVTHSQ